MSSHRTSILASLLRQIVATGGALLVFALGLMAATPHRTRAFGGLGAEGLKKGIPAVNRLAFVPRNCAS